MYEEFYHLQAKPFRLSPDPGFYFASRGHKRALAYLRYGLNQSEGFVVITGDPGTGKTTLAQILLQEMGQTDVVVAHLTTTQLEADDMLRMVAASYGLRFEGVDKAGLLKTLEAFFLARSREHKRALLVVDEAQNLPPRSVEELRMLSNLQVGGQALLQIFMLGQAQFRQMLDRPDLEQLRQRVIANYHLSALAQDECKSYIESRLSQVGWHDDPLITDEAYDAIFNYTAGIPRRINMLCDRVLLFSCLEDLHVIDGNVLRDVTDELQSETSGRPIEAAESNEIVEGTDSGPKALDRKARTGEADIVLDVLEELEEKISSTSISPPSPVQKSHVSEPPQQRPSSSPADSQINSIPDVQSNQSVAQVRQEPADIETDSEDEVISAEEAEKLLDKERFRVITGGKKVPVEGNAPGAEHTAPLPDANGDSDEVVLRKVLRLVLAFHRSPRSFPGLDDPTQPLPNGLRAIMELATADDETIKDLRQIAVMGISPPMLRAAVRFFLRRVLFVPDADDYRALGLMQDASLPDIEAHYDLIMRLLRQEKPNEDGSGIIQVGKAYERLCRSELSPGAIEPARETPDAHSPDTHIINDALDLDLSPGAGADKVSTLRAAPDTLHTIPDTSAVDLPRKRSSAGKVILLIGTVAIVGALYLTEMMGLAPGLAFYEKWWPATERSQLVQPEPAKLEVIEPEVTIPEPDTPPESALILQDEAEQTGQIDQTDNGDQVVSLNREVESAEPTIATNDDVQFMENSQVDELALAQTAADQSLLEELQAKAEAAALAQQAAEAKATAREKELESLKEVGEARLAEETSARKAAEEADKAKAQELQQLKAELTRSVESRKRAEVQAGLEAKARAEAELRAGQEAEIRALREEEARAAEQRRIEAERRAQQAEELTRLQALQQQEAEARTQAAIEENNQLAASAAEAEKLKMIAVQEATDIRSAEQAGKISQSDLQELTRKFETYYENGNTEQLVSLLALDVRTNELVERDQIFASYQAVFKSTTARSIKFKDIAWEREDDYARGNGSYEFSARIHGEQSDVRGQGEVLFQLERQQGELQITRFYFTDNVPDQSILKNTGSRISPVALNDLMRKFVGAYETGNINLFMDLFASDALSDGLGVQTIRQDYTDLFANTSLRAMNLKSMDWQWVQDGVVQGEGEYDVEVQLKGSSDLKIRHGTLRLHIAESEGLPRITQLGFQE